MMRVDHFFSMMAETIEPTPGRKMFKSKQMAAHAFVMWGTFCVLYVHVHGVHQLQSKYIHIDPR